MAEKQDRGRANAPVFALAGSIVSTEARARSILQRAIASKQQWLIPQAQSVAHKLAAHEPDAAAARADASPLGEDSPSTVARYRVEGVLTDPSTTDTKWREEIATYMAKADAIRCARQFHARGLWVEIFSEGSQELLAGLFDPHATLPAHFLLGS